MKNIIESLIEELVDEASSIGGGMVSATGGTPLGKKMKKQHKVLWSGDVAQVAAEHIVKQTMQQGIPVPMSDDSFDDDVVQEIVENVLDKMGLTKATKNIRRGALSGEVYLDKHDSNPERSKHVVSKVAKNLNKKPYSHDPPTVGLQEQKKNKTLF